MMNALATACVVRLCLVLSPVVSWCSHLRVSTSLYLSQIPPGMSPEIFAPDVISAGAHQWVSASLIRPE